jgi:hypothetical protein
MNATRSSSLSDYEIRLEGWRALTERLGVAGAIRFLTQSDPGRGHHVEERRAHFASLSLDELLERVHRPPVVG